MRQPDDSLAPFKATFEEPWQATLLALAAAMIREGHFSQSEWATELGAALRSAANDGAADTEETYYQSALRALESLSERAGLTDSVQAQRKSEWENAYRNTPHGKPVLL